MPRRTVFFTLLALCLGLVAPAARAADSVTIQNRLGIDATVTWVAAGAREPVRIRGNVRDGGKFSVPAESLRGCDRLLVQPYFDSSFQFYTPFTLDQASAMNYSSATPGGEGRLLAPVLVALVGDDRVAVPAGLPLRRLAGFMAEGMNEEILEKWLIALRLQGEKPGRYAVAIGETTWGYRDDELRFAPSAANEKQLSEIRLTLPWTPKALPGILTDMRKSGLRPLLQTVKGQDAKAFGPEGAKLDPKAESGPKNPEGAWVDVAKALEDAVSNAVSGAPLTADLVLAGQGLRYTLTLDSEAGGFALLIARE